VVSQSAIPQHAEYGVQKLPEIGSSLPGGSGLGTKVLDRSDNANLEITPISERVAFGPASFG